MTRQDMADIIGKKYLTTNVENDEWSFAKDAGTKAELEKLLGHKAEHIIVDRRFSHSTDDGNFVILVECKQNFTKEDEKQLAIYLEEERSLHRGERLVCILANTLNDKIKVWKSDITDKALLANEIVLKSMEYYEELFKAERQNDREKVMRNTYDLNTLLHKMDIDEDKRSQFVGTCLLFIKSQHENPLIGNNGYINDAMVENLKNHWRVMSAKEIRAGIENVLDGLLDGTKNKTKKIELLQRNVLNDQKIRALNVLTQDNKDGDWIRILGAITDGIYRHIYEDSSEGQDILNLFFITFNKYTGRADKNQAFTPDHICDFMTEVTEIGRKTRVLDICCGSGSFLVKAMAKEINKARNEGRNTTEIKEYITTIKEQQIFGIECEEKAYGLATTNMLIHSDGNSNIEFGSCFDKRDFIVKAKPHVILMNPPYNAKPKTIPDKYKKDWGNAKDGKEDPTKGLVFVKYLSDIAKEEDWEGTKVAVLLPMSAAIGTKSVIKNMKTALLENNTLEAVFSLPADVFYPGAAVQTVCMLFTLNKSHFGADGTPNKETFFGYYKNDGFVKKKNLGRVEQSDSDGHSLWASIEREWIQLYKNKTVKTGISSMMAVDGNKEWLCEAYMLTDYSTLTEEDFQKTLNYYLSYLIKEGKTDES